MSDYIDASKAGPSSQIGGLTDFQTNVVTLEKLVSKKTYFDKSLFIKSVLQDQEFLIITAPRRLGKTTALNIFRSFVEIDCDERGIPTGIPIEDTRSYQIFNTKLFNGDRLKIMDEKDIVDTHFGKYPVIHLDFLCQRPITSYDQAVETCKNVLREAYRQHAYLFRHRTPKLTAAEQKRCEEWCDPSAQICESDITHGLKELCYYLYQHFGKKVIILCDEYDSVIMKALFHVKGDRDVEHDIEKSLVTATGEQKSELIKQRLHLQVGNLREIVEFSNGILAAAVKGGLQYVERAVIIGISHIAGVGISGLNNTYSYTFLEKLAYVDYFGFTNDEVKEFCKRYEDVNRMSFEDLKVCYNGFTDKYGKNHIYNMWSVLQSIHQQQLANYFDETGTIERLHYVFQIPSIRVKIQQLVQMKSTIIIVKSKISVSELVSLQQEWWAPEMSEKHEPDTFLSFLLEQGYLTYAGADVKSANALQTSVSVKVPNKETKEILLEKLTSYYTEICQFDWSLQHVCKNSFDQLFTNVENDGFEAAVKVVHEDLENLLQRTLSEETCLKVNEAALHTSVCSLFLNSPDTAYCTEFSTEYSRARLDLAVHKGECGAIFEFKHCTDLSQKTTSYDALQQIKNKRYDSIFTRKDLFQKTPSTIILIGLSINNDKKLSITCQIKGKNETIHVGSGEVDRKRKAPEETNL